MEEPNLSYSQAPGGNFQQVEEGRRNVTVDLSTHYPSIPSRSLPHPGVKPPPHSFPQFSVPSSVIPPRPYLQSENRPLVLRNSREFSPHSEGSDRGEERGGPLDKIEGLIGLDQVVRGVRFAFHSCVTYPCAIFRTQCQVYPYYSMNRVYSMPWHTLTVMHRITQSQGIYSWWRGWQAQSLYLLGRPFVGAIMSTVIQQLHHKKSSRRVMWLKKRLTHLVVNGLTYAVCMPLFSFILMESVQHTVQRTYSSDYQGFREFILERPILYSDPSNRLSYLQLLFPTVLTNIAHGVTTDGMETLMGRLFSNHSHPSQLHHILHKLFVGYLSSLLADILLYPLLTVTIRLHCQGLPVLVNNVETGIGVQYITTYYSGPVDCVMGILEAEGVTGFYKGLSALLLQYAIQGLLILLLWRVVIYWERWRREQTQVSRHT